MDNVINAGSRQNALPAGTSGASSASAGNGAKIASDFQTFLKMLTVQMQNQDPLNPMEASDFAVQLATFSGVEQQMQTNQLLQTLSVQMGVMGIAQLSGWIGMEARATGPVWVDGTLITLAPQPSALADKAVLVVRDATGKEVSREPVPLDGVQIDWPGTDSAGKPLSSGTYTLELESHAHGLLLETRPVAAYRRVQEAQAGAGGEVLLVFAGGIRIPASGVTALRHPDGA